MWDYFREPQLDLKAKNKVEGTLEVKNIFMERNYYFVSEHARDLCVDVDLLDLVELLLSLSAPK